MWSGNIKDRTSQPQTTVAPTRALTANKIGNISIIRLEFCVSQIKAIEHNNRYRSCYGWVVLKPRKGHETSRCFAFGPGPRQQHFLEALAVFLSFMLECDIFFFSATPNKFLILLNFALCSFLRKPEWVLLLVAVMKFGQRFCNCLSREFIKIGLERYGSGLDKFASEEY